MFLRRFVKSIIGFITCTIIVVVLMLLIWPTIDFQALIDLNTDMTTNHGAGGHFWVTLLMLLVVNMFLPINIPNPIPLTDELISNSFGSAGLYVLILAIWLIGAFAGGLASRGGLRSGAWSAILSFLFLDFIFATMTASMNLSVAGLHGFPLFIVSFLFSLVVGSFIFVPIIGLAGGIFGGILGKMLFTKDKKKDESKEE